MALPFARYWANAYRKSCNEKIVSGYGKIVSRTSNTQPVLHCRYGTAVQTQIVTPAVSTTVSLKKRDSPSGDGPEHIILPNPSLTSFNVAARVLPSTIAEQFAVLNACIRSGSMGRAERIMTELYRTRPEEMKMFTDLHIYNTFLHGFNEMAPPMTKQSLAWFDSMKKYGLIPDLNTFAIVIKGFLKTKSYHTARMILQEMQQEYQYSIEDMLRSDFLSESDVSLFREMTTAIQANQPSEVHKLLQELERATNSILGAPSTQSKVTEATIGSVTTSTLPTASTPREELILDTPEARSTGTLGIKYLQQQLATLRDQEAALKMDPYELQSQLENHGYEVAMDRLVQMRESSIERGDTLSALNMSPLKKTMWRWHTDLSMLIKEEIQRCEEMKEREADRSAYGPFLSLLPPEKLSIITILELLRLHNSSGIADGMKTARAVIDVGKAVEMEYNATQIKKVPSKVQARNQEIHQLFASGKLFNMAVRRAHMLMTQEADAHRSLVQSSEGDTGSQLGMHEWTPVWPSTIRAKVGSVLTSLLIEASKIPMPSRDPETGEKIWEEIPAFYHTYQYVRGKRVGIIKFSEPLTKLISREPLRDTLHPRFLPMIVHPRPWLSCNWGGYLTAKTSCMRIKDSPEQLAYLVRASEEDRLHAALAGLDVLGSTRWRVNKNVFNVVLEAWNTGDKIADIPPAIDLPSPLPEKPENYDTDPKARYNWVKQVKDIQTAEKNNHSLRCDVNYKVETARAFLNLPMYFPHNMDFRGRAYPIPSSLNHIGSDLCRGLLQFEDAKPLGERGWRWLKIHLANLYGFDKHSFSERENFTLENMDNIIDAVETPLSGKRWWLKAESPWQCLAACYEIAAAYRSGKPEEFRSQLPVHQDGTCNGLQHYAALGGDLAGARAVNLAPGDRPADVYTGVADMVNKQIDEAAAAGDENAKLLQGKISRKVVKQTVMTNVYGVTFIGARAQIENRLKEQDDIPPEKIFVLASYLARKVFSSMGEMFHGAHKIQNWLTDSARRIARSVPTEALQDAGILPADDGVIRGPTEDMPGRKRRQTTRKRPSSFSARNPGSNQMTSVIWTTPLGLPIVQPYRRSGKKQVGTLLQTVFIEDPDASRPVNAMKQSSAFPPNFIHSLDATHMLMSAVACHKRGMTFASVHDSYWTHACDVDAMNEVIRDEFIELHSQPIMENLFKEFHERYKGYKIPAILEYSGKLSAKSSAKSSAESSKTTPKDSTGTVDVSEAEEQLDAADRAIFGAAEDNSEEELVDELDEDGNANSEDASSSEGKAARKPGSTSRKYEYTWQDLTFAPLPAKGEFDIHQVKQSTYFFH